MPLFSVRVRAAVQYPDKVLRVRAADEAAAVAYVEGMDLEDLLDVLPDDPTPHVNAWIEQPQGA